MRVDIHGNKNHFRDSLLPEGMDTQDIGTSENRWRSITVRDATLNSLVVSGTATIPAITPPLSLTGSTYKSYTAVGGQANQTLLFINPTASGTTQQQGLYVRIDGVASGNATERLAAVFESSTGGGLGAGTGNFVGGININVYQGLNDTTTQIVASELSVNSNKANATLDMNPPQVGYSAVSGGAFIAGIAYAVGGAPQWVEGLQMALGSIASGGYAIRYKGTGAANTNFAITELGQVLVGNLVTSTMGNGEVSLGNSKYYRASNAAGTASTTLIGLSNTDVVFVANGTNNVALAAGGGAALVGTTFATGAASGDFIIKNNAKYRAVNQGGTNTLALVSLDTTNRLNLDANSAALLVANAVTQTTIGANGAASALTANPVGYIKVNIGGSDRIIPYYNP